MSSYCYICSQPRSGSTLLSILSGTCDQVISVGEMSLFGKAHHQNIACSCGANLSKCKFWGEIISRISELKHDNNNLYTTQAYRLKYKRSLFNQWLNQMYFFGLRHCNKYLAGLSSTIKNTFPYDSELAIKNNLILANTIFNLVGYPNPVLLDSTKSIYRLQQLNLKIPEKLKVIILLRDGRGTINSYMKNDKRSFENIVHSWKHHMERQIKGLHAICEKRKLVIRYEDLCEDTKNQLHAICDFLDIPYQTKIPKLSGHFHMLGGNTGAYNSKSIKLDEEWKEKLDKKKLDVFENIAGKVNRMNGYNLP